MSDGKPPPLSIQIVFCSPDGKTTEGPLIECSSEPPRQFDDTSWDKDRCIREFHGFLRNRDNDGLQAAVRALDRLDCWREAFRQLITGRSPDEVLGGGLLSFWITYGLQSIPLALKGDLILVIDAFKHLLPPYTGPALTLYRGELLSRNNDRIYGLSWTPDFSVAKMFANRRHSLGEGPGVLLEMVATPDMIVASVEQTSSHEHTSWLGEKEYLIDPRLIRGVCVRAD